MQTPASVRAVLLGLGLTVALSVNAQEVRGITNQEIRLGSLQDLSGPLASAGNDIRNGMQMRVQEVNAQGGVQGRQVRLLVEDHAYDPKRAVLATQKLLDRDEIFMMVGQLGTATTLASWPLLKQKNTVNFFPLTATAHTYDPPQALMFAYLPSYADQIARALPGLVKDKQAKRVCAIYQDDEFGLEVVRGAEAGLQSTGLSLIERMSYKRGATEFSSQVVKAAAAKCDMVVLATVIRETVGVMTEARKLGFAPTVVATVSAYSAHVPRLGGQNVEGLYATVVVDQPYVDSGPAPLREWAVRYKAAYAEEPSVFSAQGYFVIDTFIKAARQAGAPLSTESFVKSLDAFRFPATIFGTPEMTFSPTKRLGIEAVRVSRIQDGKWVSAAP